MADNITDYSIEIGADATKAREVFNAAKREGADAAKEIDKQFAEAGKKARGEVDKTAKEVNKTAKSATVAARDISKQFSDTGKKASDEVGKATRNAKAESERMAQAVKLVSERLGMDVVKLARDFADKQIREYERTTEAVKKLAAQQRQILSANGGAAGGGGISPAAGFGMVAGVAGVTRGLGAMHSVASGALGFITKAQALKAAYQLANGPSGDSAPELTYNALSKFQVMAGVASLIPGLNLAAGTASALASLLQTALEDTVKLKQEQRAAISELVATIKQQAKMLFDRPLSNEPLRAMARAHGLLPASKDKLDPGQRVSYEQAFQTYAKEWGETNKSLFELRKNRENVIKDLVSKDGHSRTTAEAQYLEYEFALKQRRAAADSKLHQAESFRQRMERDNERAEFSPWQQKTIAEIVKGSMRFQGLGEMEQQQVLALMKFRTGMPLKGFEQTYLLDWQRGHRDAAEDKIPGMSRPFRAESFGIEQLSARLQQSIFEGEDRKRRETEAEEIKKAVERNAKRAEEKIDKVFEAVKEVEKMVDQGAAFQ